ncbi:MAG TPA: response regulator, partial [Candidatus Binatia bacterium]|nr:response regulator [Candidatus Binatia bacterium]
VENEPRLLSMTAEWLRGLGYTVQACASADEAAALLASRDFDLLFTDAVMPGALDGMDLVVRARELDPAQPVVLTSGFSAHHAEQRRDMALGYLQKPYSKSELAQTVRRGLDHGPHHPRATEARP